MRLTRFRRLPLVRFILLSLVSNELEMLCVHTASGSGKTLDDFFSMRPRFFPPASFLASEGHRIPCSQVLPLATFLPLVAWQCDPTALLFSTW